jgi:hypothetical protein
MSIMSIGRGNGNGSKRLDHTAPPYPPRPPVMKMPDLETAQLELGTRTLEAVDQLTGMTADEIERVAEQVIEGAEETAAVLRALARRVRENGTFTNERLARFVNVANNCADIARSLQEMIERRDEQQPPQPKKPETMPEHEREIADIDDAPELAAAEEQIKRVRSRVAP